MAERDDRVPVVEGVVRLRHVALRTTRFAESVEFYTTVWGLEAVSVVDGALACLRGTGDEHHILQLIAGDANGLDHVSFALPEATDVDAAARRLEAAGIEITDGPGPLERPGGGYGLTFADPEGRRWELSAEVEAVATRPAGPTPRRVSHVVLNTADLEGSVAFARRVLGLRVSDWSERQMAFLRCDRTHHCVAFNRAEWASVNHVAYELADLDALMRGIGRLRRAGHQPLWGPGRHGPGDNAFCYFADPAGMVCEYTCGMVEVDEGWVPRVWPRTPELSDVWGTAGPPPPEARRLMAGAPEHHPAGRTAAHRP